MTPTPLADSVRKERRWKTAFVLALFMLAVGITGLSVLALAEKRASEARENAIEEITSNLEELCLEGAIDCRGNEGLPGSEGVPGTGIRSIICNDDGRFEFTLTNGSTVTIGDCVAEDGARGPRGGTGDQGSRGPRGFIGPRGPQGPPGRDGAQGKPGRRGPPGGPGPPKLPNPPSPNAKTTAEVRTPLGTFTCKVRFSGTTISIRDCELLTPPEPPGRSTA